MADKIIDFLQNLLLKLGCEEKQHPGSVSSARVIAYIFALTVVATATIMTVQAEFDHLLVAEVIAGTMTALGLRSIAKRSIE